MIKYNDNYTVKSFHLSDINFNKMCPKFAYYIDGKVPHFGKGVGGCILF